MSEFGIPYSLVTPAGTLTINPTPMNQDGLYLSDVAGLDGGSVRSIANNLPQRDGAYVFDALRGAMYPTLTGFIRAGTTSSRSTIMDNLKSYTESIRTADGTLKWTPSGQSQRQLTVRLAADVQIGNQAGILKTFQVQLVAGNPLTVAASGSSGSFGVLTGSIAGTFSFPFYFPIGFGNPLGALLTVTPNGNAPAWPTFTINGPVTAPAMYNATTGKILSLPTLTLAAGDVLTVDMYNETATLNAATNSQIGLIDFSVSEFWSLAVGANSVYVTCSSATAASAASLTYSDSYV